MRAMRAALVLVALLVLGSVYPAATIAVAGRVNRGSTGPLKVPPSLAPALVRQGYAVRHPCGSVLEPPPSTGKQGQLLHLRQVPACWLVIYKGSYSVSISPHSSRAAARLAYERTYNKWARNTRRIAIGPLLVSAFRIPDAEWNAIRRIVSATAISSH
jgi:hypothetical protein